MIDGQRVKARLNIGEIPQKERSHIRIDLIALRDRQISTRATSRFPTLFAPRDLGELAQRKTVPNKPRDARQLASTIGDTCDKAGKWSDHASRSNSITKLASEQTLVPDFVVSKRGSA
jgi:hypothetical protein